MRVQDLALVAILITSLVGLVLFFYLPVYPSITVTFRVTTSPQYSITIGPTSFLRASVSSTVNVPLGKILLLPLDGNTGPYNLTITVRYGTSILSFQNFGSIGDGGYQMKATYGYGSDSPTIPYAISLALLSTSSHLAMSNVTVTPT
jgi:hypothetical protein